MENLQSILKKISSKYILESTFDFIKDKTFKLKLFNYSKYFQQKLGLELYNYLEAYVTNLEINIDDYLYRRKNIYPQKFKKNILNEYLEEDLAKKKFDIKIVEEFIIKNLEKEIEKEKSEEEKLKIVLGKKQIEIYSPFLDFFSKTKAFESFSIPISINVIKKFNLEKDYISVFENFNKTGIKYDKLNIYINSNDIDYLKTLKIDLGELVSLKLNVDTINDEGENREEDEDEDEENKTVYNIDDINKFYKTLFSYKNMANNLILFDLNCIFLKNFEIDPNLFENLNNFKSLKILLLSGLHFQNPFMLKLNNLIGIFIYDCLNIIVDENFGNNLKRLVIKKTKTSIFPKSKSLLKFPLLESFLIDNDIKEVLNSKIDFSVLNKISYFEGYMSDFIHLPETKSLKEVKLLQIDEGLKIDENLEVEKELIKKIVSLESLQNIEFLAKYIADNEFSRITRSNYSLKKIQIEWLSTNGKCILNNLLNKFPNLSNFEIFFPVNTTIPENFKPPMIKLEENKKSKINKILLDIGVFTNDIQLFCGPYDKLSKIEFTSNINFRTNFPIFGKKCNVKFQSLTLFHLTNRVEGEIKEIDFDMLNNLYNNLNCFPNLKDFKLDCILKVSKDFYIQFLKKLLSMKLKSIYFSIKENYKEEDEPYTEVELKEIYPEFDYDLYEELNIKKV